MENMVIDDGSWEQKGLYRDKVDKVHTGDKPGIPGRILGDGSLRSFEVHHCPLLPIATIY